MRYLLCLLLLAQLGLAGVQAADVPGIVVFVRLAGSADDARSDVYEQRLAGGSARMLIAHTSLPKAFHGRVERALPSADGAMLLIQESHGVAISSKRTGSTRMVFGSGYAMTGDEKVAEEFDGGCWLWSRANGLVRKIALASVHEHAEPLGWSPRGRLLLVHVSNMKTDRETIRVFDAATGKTRSLRAIDELTFARWTPDASAVLVGDRPREASTRLTLVSLNGKAQRVSTRPGRVFTAAVSPGGSQVAVGDTRGFYICSRNGRTRRTLAVPPPKRMPTGDMAFSANGRRLAILFSSTNGGGLYADIHESLWTIDTRTAAARLVAQWDVTPGNSPGEDTTHLQIGWAPSQSALLLMGQSCTLQGAETEWRRLSLQPADSTQPAQVLADTGPCGIDMSWCGGHR